MTKNDDKKGGTEISVSAEDSDNSLSLRLKHGGKEVTSPSEQHPAGSSASQEPAESSLSKSSQSQRDQDLVNPEFAADISSAAFAVYREASLKKVKQKRKIAIRSGQTPGPMSHVMSDPYIRRRQRFAFAVVFTAIVTTLAGWFFSAEFRSFVKEAYQTAHDRVVYLGESNRKAAELAARQAAIKLEKVKKKTATPPVLSGKDLPCSSRDRALRKMVKAKTKTWKYSHLIDISNCYALEDNYLMAYQALRRGTKRANKATESIIDGDRSHDGIADYFLTRAALSVHPYSKETLEKSMGNRCRSWQATNTCVAKLYGRAMLGGQPKLLEAAFKKIENGRRKLTYRARVYLWLAGARVAELAHQPRRADHRYQAAINIVSDRDAVLARTTYERYAVLLLKEGRSDQVVRMTKDALLGFSENSRISTAKLEFLAQVAPSSNRPGALRRYLKRDELATVVARNLDLMDLYTTESLRLGLEPDFQKVIDKAHRLFPRHVGRNVYAQKSLAEISIRNLIAQGLYATALRDLRSYEVKYGASPFVHHMKGIAILHRSNHRSAQLDAAREFQRAVKAHTDWQSIYGLGVALTRGERFEQAKSAIQQLQSVARGDQQRFWLDMLKAEWYMAQQADTRAEPILNRWLQKSPDAFTPRWLALRLATKRGHRELAKLLKRELDELGAKLRFMGTEEGLSAPVGPMALNPQIVIR